MTRQELLILAGVGVGAVLGWPAVIGPDNAVRTARALAGGRVSCRGDLAPGAIVVPGSGLKVNDAGSSIPDDLEKTRLEAAAAAYRQGVAPLIILLNGRLHSGSVPVEVDYLQKAYGRESDGGRIPPEAIVTEHVSRNTATNMAELARIVTSRDIKNVVVVSNDFHLARATQLACGHGVPASSLEAEKLVPGRSAAGALVRLKEFLEVALTAWDPKGLIPTAIHSVLPR